MGHTIVIPMCFLWWFCPQGLYLLPLLNVSTGSQLKDKVQDYNILFGAIEANQEYQFKYIFA